MEICNKDISVIVPAYNSETTILNCLKALEAQTFPPIEIIVVDDGSTDSTADLSKKWARVISNTSKKGAAGARNSGASMAKAGMLAFIDSDCVPQKDWLKNIADAFSDPAVVAVGGGYCCGSDNSFWQVFCFEELYFRRQNRGPKVKTLVSNNFACRKSIFKKEKGFPEHYPVCEDMLLSYKMSKQGKVLWLRENGVQHHFANSLKAYLKHQYFFGGESIRFFIQNPKLLTIPTHQGKKLYFTMILALLFAMCLLSLIISTLSGNFFLSRLFLRLSILLLLGHFLFYISFMYHLIKKKFHSVIKAYAVSLLRDLVSSLSLFEGVLRAVKTV